MTRVVNIGFRPSRTLPFGSFTLLPFSTPPEARREKRQVQEIRRQKNKDLDDLDLVRGDPDIDLLKTRFQDFFVRFEEHRGFGVVTVDTNPKQLVVIRFSARSPVAMNPHQVLGKAREPMAQFPGSLVKLFPFNFRSVVVLHREEEFEPLEPIRCHPAEEPCNEADVHREAFGRRPLFQKCRLAVCG